MGKKLFLPVLVAICLILPLTIPAYAERNCVENSICAFPGDFLKYRNWDTFDDFSEIAIVEFKEKIDDNTINVFIDGFGSKPLTYTLNLKTGIEKNSQYGVNRPFNLLEPIPMKIGQQVDQYIEGYYRSTIEAESIGNLKEVGLTMDIERTIMAAKVDLGNGDVVALGYDKETGILIINIEKYEFDGKQYTSGMALIDTNMFSEPIKITTSKIIPVPEPERETMVTEMQEKSESVPLSDGELARFADAEVTDEPPTWVYGLIGFFVLIGIPVIIIVLIIWKIKQRRDRAKIHQ